MDEEWHRSDEKREYLLKMECEINKKQQLLESKELEYQKLREIKQ